MSELSDRFRALRKELGLSQVKAAEVCGVSVGWVEKMEAGSSVPMDIAMEGAIARLRSLQLKEGD